MIKPKNNNKKKRYVRGNQSNDGEVGKFWKLLFSSLLMGEKCENRR